MQSKGQQCLQHQSKGQQCLQHHLPITTVALLGSLFCPLLIASTLISYFSPGKAWENWLAWVTAVCSSQLLLESRRVGRYLMRKLSCWLAAAAFQVIVTIWSFSVTVTFITENGSGQKQRRFVTFLHLAAMGLHVTITIWSRSITVMFTTMENSSGETDKHLSVLTPQ